MCFLEILNIKILCSMNIKWPIIRFASSRVVEKSNKSSNSFNACVLGILI